jgi:hypothetical protein
VALLWADFFCNTTLIGSLRKPWSFRASRSGNQVATKSPRASVVEKVPAPWVSTHCWGPSTPRHSAVPHDKSERRSAQDDAFVGNLMRRSATAINSMKMPLRSRLRVSRGRSQFPAYRSRPRCRCRRPWDSNRMWAEGATLGSMSTSRYHPHRTRYRQ